MINTCTQHSPCSERSWTTDWVQFTCLSPVPHWISSKTWRGNTDAPRAPFLKLPEKERIVLHWFVQQRFPSPPPDFLYRSLIYQMKQISLLKMISLTYCHVHLKVIIIIWLRSQGSQLLAWYRFPWLLIESKYSSLNFKLLCLSRWENIC